VCDCYTQFDGVNCGVTGVIFTSTTLDILLLHSQLDYYSGNVLHLKSERPSSSSFYLIYADSDDDPTFSMRGDGLTELYKASHGSFRITCANTSLRRLGLSCATRPFLAGPHRPQDCLLLK
jgi:hypothetical protein